MSARTLHLHIGFPKTGTTSIQASLSRSTEALAGQGITYFTDLHPAVRLQQDPVFHSWLRHPAPGRVAADGVQVRDIDLLTERLDAVGGDVVVSGELLACVYSTENLREWHASLRTVFDEIRVIAYLRRQDQQLVSQFQEGSKPRNLINELLGNAPVALPEWAPGHDLFLDYGALLDRWASVFGDDALTLRVFEPGRLRDGSAVADFFEVLGVPTHEQVPRSNESRGLVAAKLGHLTLGRGAVDPVPMWRMLLEDAPPAPRMRPSRAQAEACYRRYAESNARLNARFAVVAEGTLFDEDFSGYPEQAEQHWDEGSANAALLHVLSRIDEIVPPTLEPRALRDAALAIGDAHPEVAATLLRIALTHRPRGEVLQRKLAEYDRAAETRRAPLPKE